MNVFFHTKEVRSFQSHCSTKKVIPGCILQFPVKSLTSSWSRVVLAQDFDTKLVATPLIFDKLVF